MGKNKIAHHNGTHIIGGVKIPIAYTFLSLLFAIAATYLVTRISYSGSATEITETSSFNSPYQIKRLSGFKFIQPLLSAKPIYETEKYSEIKEKISDLILKYKDQGIISSASFYLRDFDKSDWMAVNVEEKYSPGSIIKIPLMMTILKQAEKQPEFLNQALIYNQNFIFAEPKKNHFISQQIKFGNVYTMKELLKYMIEYSDNNAATILFLKTDKEMMKNMFAEFGLPELDFSKSNISLNVVECSSFLESLFNATYLNAEQSEYAIELLTKSSFTEGISKGIPNNNIIIAHKFGEAGSELVKELHETAIIFLRNQPYLLTIMTRGNKGVEFSQLSSVIQGIASESYSELIKLSKPK